MDEALFSIQMDQSMKVTKLTVLDCSDQMENRLLPSPSGDWNENVREGHGTYTYPNNGTYEGEWKNHQRQGKGTYTYAATSTYLLIDRSIDGFEILYMIIVSNSIRFDDRGSIHRYMGERQTRGTWRAPLWRISICGQIPR